MEKKVSKIVHRLIKIRKERKLTQVEMADKLGITRRQYQCAEKGNMPDWVVEELCDHLGLKLLALDKEVLK